MKMWTKGLLLSSLLLFALASAAQSDYQPATAMLPQVHQAEQDLSGWWMSEKLDGVRGYWDGSQLYSKNGLLFSPPPEFTRNFPPFPVEGELWGGRGRFEQTVSSVNQLQPHPGWLDLKFAIFDLPQQPGPFCQRILRAQRWFAAHPSDFAYVIEQSPVRDQNHIQTELERVTALGGEGLIVRDPQALYAAGRQSSIVKVKPFQDAEATVVAHLPGKGRHLGRLGALLVERADGVRFRIGGGFSDAEREDPPPPGSIISYKFYGHYQSGLPKFPSFLRIRRDSKL